MNGSKKITHSPYISPKPRFQSLMSICCESPAVFIQVRFVDFGNSALLPSSNLRPIYEDLMDLPAQVLGCYVADVKPNDKSWTEGIKIFSAWFIF